MKRIKFILFLILFLFINTYSVHADNPKIIIDFFGSSTCSHCKNVKEDLMELKQEIPNFSDIFTINSYEISVEENKDLIYKYYEKYSVPKDDQGYVPIIFIGKHVINGDTDFKEQFLNIYEIYKDNPNQYISDMQELGFEDFKNLTIVDIENNTDIDMKTNNQDNDLSLPILIASSTTLLVSIITVFIINKKRQE